MFKLVSRFHCLLVLIILLHIGCSGSASDLVTPVNGNDAAPGANENQANVKSSHQLWGLWQFTANPVTQSLDVVPLRCANWHQNVLPFLEPPPLTKLTLEYLEFENPLTIIADIGLTHPFEGLDEFTGFDVCGIVFTVGTNTKYGGGIRMPRCVDTRLTNPDGYTRWWNPDEFPHVPVYGYTDGLLGAPDSFADYNCCINGYKYYSDELDYNDDLSDISLTSRGQFSPGKKNVRRYIIYLGNTNLTFNYAVDACWEPPVGSPPWDVPGDFPEGANRSEPYRIEVTELNNSLYYEDYPPGGGGSAQLQVDVYDWYNAYSNILSCRSDCGMAPVLNVAPTETGDGYARYIVDLDGSTLTKNGKPELLFICRSEDTGYDGFIPGEPVCAYFDYPIEVTDPTPDTGWGLTWASDAVTESYAIAPDNSGNIYVAGIFNDGYSGGADFDPGPGVELHESDHNAFDVFLSKFDMNGDFKWARTWGDYDDDYGYSVACDDNGDIYVTGSFRGTVDFDTGPGVAERTSGNDYLGHSTKDVFLSKFNPAGVFLWVRTWGSGSDSANDANTDIGYGVAVDSNQNVYVTGIFCNVVDFNPGSGIEEYDAGKYSDVFLTKFDSFGNHSWARTWGENYVGEIGYDIEVDETDNIYIVGLFGGIVDFDPGPATEEHVTNGYSDIFLSKFYTTGDFVWAKTWGGEGMSEVGFGVSVDCFGNVLVAGRFTSAVDFDPGPGIDIHDTVAKADAFVNKLDSDGDYLWARTWGGYASDDAYSVTTDGLGYVYVTSRFMEEADLDPGPGLDEHIDHGYYWDSAVSKFTPDGDYIWAATWGAEMHDWPNDIFTDDTGNIFVCGECDYPIDLNPGPGVDVHNEDPAGFLMKLLPDGWW